MAQPAIRRSPRPLLLADALKDEEAKVMSSGPDKAGVLLELAEVYGKLNNDNQVMAALSSALAQDPARLEIYDRLCVLYEAKKRWPDLVKVLLDKYMDGTIDEVHIFFTTFINTMKQECRHGKMLPIPEEYRAPGTGEVRKADAPVGSCGMGPGRGSPRPSRLAGGAESHP